MQRPNNVQALFNISLNSDGEVVAQARGQEEDAEDSVSTTCFDSESTSSSSITSSSSSTSSVSITSPRPDCAQEKPKVKVNNTCPGTHSRPFIFGLRGGPLKTNCSACPVCDIDMFEKSILDPTRRATLIRICRTMVPSSQECAPERIQENAKKKIRDRTDNVSTP